LFLAFFVMGPGEHLPALRNYAKSLIPTHHFKDYLYWSQHHQLESSFYCFVGLIVSNACCIPIAGILMTSSGFLFKMSTGFLLMYSAYNVAAWAGFGIGRFVLQKRVQAMSRDNVLMHALSCAVEKRGWRLVFLLQLPPTGVPSP
jgi:uncharacterized membrane protein YdjX (TVP38/TMEM64 family)